MDRDPTLALTFLRSTLETLFSSRLDVMMAADTTDAAVADFLFAALAD